MLHFIKTTTLYREIKINLDNVFCINYIAETNKTQIVYSDGEVAEFPGRELYDKIPVL